MELDPFISQEGGVGSEDAVLLAQLDQLVGQLAAGAVQVDLVDQEADAADRPEGFDVLVAVAGMGRGEVGVEVEVLPIAADQTAEADLRPAGVAVPSDDDELAAFEEVGQVAGSRPG